MASLRAIWNRVRLFAYRYSLPGRPENRIGLILLAFSALVLLILAPIFSLARPGGGSSYSGGSSGGGSSGGGGGDGEGLVILIRLIIEYPQIGIPVIVIFIAYKLYEMRREPQTVITSTQTLEEKRQKARVANTALERFREDDPNFSRTLFLDFAQHLFYKFHHWRSKPEFSNLAVYLDPRLMTDTIKANQAPVEVTELVIAAIHITGFHRSPGYDTINAEIDANYTETRKNKSTRFILTDQWVFRRRSGTLSGNPEKMQDLGCPNCGSNLELSPTGQCRHCNLVVQPGNLQWELVHINHLSRQTQIGLPFGTYSPEKGNDLPTLTAPNLVAAGHEFARIHKLENIDAWFNTFNESVVFPAFRKIYDSWSTNDWQKARPLLTDNLFRSHLYWIETYKKHKVFNRLDDLQFYRVQPVKLELDTYYESLTIRIHASVYDYMQDEAGNITAGSKNSIRRFTEYWTFVRRAGVEKPESDFDPDKCPNCGAPINMGMSGVCSYCNSKVTRGDFGWVLSRIEQDETYIG